MVSCPAPRKLATACSRERRRRITPHGIGTPAPPAATRPSGDPHIERLITPHGDWEPAAHAGGWSPSESRPHYPHGDWKLLQVDRQLHGLALITPHGDWKRHVHTIPPGSRIRSLPLMGIGNRTPAQDGPAAITVLITPHGDWKRGRLRAGAPEVLPLITPHGDWKRPRSVRSAPRWRSHYPSWGLETAWCLTWRAPSTRTHYPSWGLETSCRRPTSCSRSAHYPSWGLETLR